MNRSPECLPEGERKLCLGDEIYSHGALLMFVDC